MDLQGGSVDGGAPGEGSPVLATAARLFPV